MQEIEILIKDLTAHKAQIELARGQKITKEKIIDFVAMLIKGDPNDKEYQKKLIDNLVYKVFVYDDTVVTYLIFGNDKEIKEISLADNDKAITGLTQRVQPLSLLVHRLTAKTNTVIYKVNRRELYCAVELPLSDYKLYGKQLAVR